MISKELSHDNLITRVIYFWLFWNKITVSDIAPTYYVMLIRLSHYTNVTWQ